LNAADAAPRQAKSKYPETFVARLGERVKRALGEPFGLTIFGVNLTTLPPAAMSALRHAHTTQDEFIYVLEGTPTLVTDSRIEHVLQNLIANAIKYRRKEVPPEIHVSAKLEKETWVISVRDNGIGIEPQYRQSIFQIFQRLHGRDIPGTGVGLALAQKIVETNAGKMWVESEPGVGSAFYFTIPLSDDNSAASRAAR